MISMIRMFMHLMQENGSILILMEKIKLQTQLVVMLKIFKKNLMNYNLVIQKKKNKNNRKNIVNFIMKIKN